MIQNTNVWPSAEEFAKYVSIVLDSTNTKIERKEAVAKLHKMSQHVVNNSFHGIDFAGDPRGINACSPHDMMPTF
jgi:hypothetical protein